MTEKEIKTALSNENLCRIAFIEENYPYICPFQYVYVNEQLFFHFTNYGKKINIINKNKNVCVSIEKFNADLSSYYFISIQGKLVKINNKKLIKEVRNKIVENAKRQFSVNFLLAHGFKTEGGWDSLNNENLLIFKLEESGDRIGLKSNRNTNY
ncbi:MAG: pyridoxamine 5'-phosphate oxidase family protein [Candidatus Hermodarchaeota archaeon]